MSLTAEIGPAAGPGSSAIADKTKTCLQSFNDILHISSADHDAQDAVNDNLSRFRIWAGNIGAYHVDSRSADYRVREAPEVADRILELLDELMETNTDVHAIVSGERGDAALLESDGASDSNDGQTELSELCLAAGDTISSLLKVSALLRKATGRDRYAKAAASKDNPFMEAFDIKHVAEKFPKLDRRPWLRDRLGRANVQRRHYLRYARKHHDRIAHEPVAMESVYPAVTAFQKFETSESHSKTIVSSRPTLAPTDASTLKVDMLPPVQGDHIEQLDERLSQATSVVTSTHEHHEDGELQVIRLNEISKDGQAFECPYCWSIVQTRRQRTWRKHVLRDIRAWVCTFEDCNAGLFEDRDAWFQHEIDSHRRVWSCQSCSDATFSSAGSMFAHLGSVHGDKGSDAANAIVDASSRPITDIQSTACPMCDDWELQLKERAQEMGILFSSVLVAPARDFKHHLSQHLEQLALFSIPPTLERLLESESQTGAVDDLVRPSIEGLRQWTNLIVQQEDCSDADTDHNLDKSDNESQHQGEAEYDWNSVNEIDSVLPEGDLGSSIGSSVDEDEVTADLSPESSKSSALMETMRPEQIAEGKQAKLRLEREAKIVANSRMEAAINTFERFAANLKLRSRVPDEFAGDDLARYGGQQVQDRGQESVAQQDLVGQDRATDGGTGELLNAVVDPDEDYHRRMEEVQRELGQIASTSSEASVDLNRERQREREERHTSPAVDGKSDADAARYQLPPHQPHGPSKDAETSIPIQAHQDLDDGFEGGSGNSGEGSTPKVAFRPMGQDHEYTRNRLQQRNVAEATLSARGYQKPDDEVKVGLTKKPKSILKMPTAAFPDGLDSEEADDVAISKRSKDSIPPNARWTKIDRRLVNPEALIEAGERFEERPDSVIVMRVVSEGEVEMLAARTRAIREEAQRANDLLNKPMKMD